MADVKVNGEYLSRGIYFERKPAGIGNNWHTYLVYRDGQGGAWVVRGGPNTSQNLSDFFDIKIDAGIDISQTLDSYGTETPAKSIGLNF